MGRLFHRRSWYCAGLILLSLAAILFSVFYLCNDHASLTRWYFSLNDCFYKSYEWSEKFFTTETFHKGRMFCFVALGLSLLLIIAAVRKLIQKQMPPTTSNHLQPSTLHYYLLLSIAIAAWHWGNSMVQPSFDEVFSTENCAGIHPLQTISYYMLPNNHMYYNLINNLLFHNAGDRVFTGRMISLVGCIGVALLSFGFLKELFRQRWLAFFVSVVMLFQFTPWAFSFQARGYELQLLAAWIAFPAFIRYYEHKDKTQLLRFSIGVIAGYVLIPTFLYFHAGMMPFALLRMIRERKIDISLARYTAYSFVIIFLFYLPGLCFSGLGAFNENGYVKSIPMTMQEFLPVFGETFRYFIRFIFSFLFGDNSDAGVILCCIPVLVYFTKDRRAKTIVTFYLLEWLVFCVIVLYMKRNPFNRNLIIHNSCTLAVVCYCVYVLLQSLSERLRIVKIGVSVFTLLLGALLYHFIRKDKENACWNMYGYNVNEMNTRISEAMKQIPSGSSVAFDNNSFYEYYMLRDKNIRRQQCPQGGEDFYIRRTYDEMRPQYRLGYKLISTFDNDSELYQRQ